MDIPLIEQAYNDIAPRIEHEFPDKETRELIKSLMEKLLPDYEIKCDEENNPVNVIDSGNVFVRVIKRSPIQKTVFNYVDVIF